MPTSEPKKPAKAAKGAAQEQTSAFLKPLQPSQELAAIVGSAPLAAPGGGEQGLGVHQDAQAPEPAEQARDHGGREASGGVRRQEQGEHVRDEQAPCPASQVNSLSGEQCKPARGELRRSFMAEPLLSRRRRGDARGALLGAGNGLRSEDVQPVPLASDQASARPYAPALQQHARDSQPSAQAPAPAGRVLAVGRVRSSAHTKWCLRTRSNLAGHYV